MGKEGGTDLGLQHTPYDMYKSSGCSLGSIRESPVRRARGRQDGRHSDRRVELARCALVEDDKRV